MEWFIATRKLYELVRKTLNTLYDNAGKECEDDLLDQKQNKRLFQIQCITQIDSELQDFRHRTPGPLRWDVPVPEGQQSEFLRERYLLKARYVKIHPSSVLWPLTIFVQIFVSQTSHIQADSLTTAA